MHAARLGFEPSLTFCAMGVELACACGGRHGQIRGQAALQHTCATDLVSLPNVALWKQVIRVVKITSTADCEVTDSIFVSACNKYSSACAEVNAYLADPAAYVAAAKKACDHSARLNLEAIVDCLTTARCKSFEDCMERGRFQVWLPQ